MRSKIHDLDRYRISKEVIKDLSKFIIELDLFVKVCYTYKKYKFVAAILEVATNARTIIKAQLEFYKKVEKNRGADELVTQDPTDN